MSDDFYILSLKWTRDEMITWWGPNNSGYSRLLSQAGRYSREAVERDPGYYNNGCTTLAIPCADVEAAAERVVLECHLTRLTKKRLADVTNGGEDECPHCGQHGPVYHMGLRVVGDAP
jgi:hypothetical protein